MNALLDDVFGVDEQGNPLDELTAALDVLESCSEENIDLLIDHLREHHMLKLDDGELLITMSSKYGWQVATPASLRINKNNAKDMFEALAAAYYVMKELE